MRLGSLMRRTAVVSAAFALDRAIGDPVRPTHPARLMGLAIARYDVAARSWAAGDPARERQAGIALALGLPAAAYLGSRAALRLLPRSLRPLGEAWLVSTAFAAKDLADAARRVEAGLDESLAAGRYRVSMIVGRDTAEMTEADVVRATVETVAENTSDGVVAPILAAVVGGAPAAMAYKAVSTLDSMVGYKNERYRDFGWASARLDDLLNLAPARLTALLATAAGGRGLGPARRWWEDRTLHESPNAGLVEASFAQALQVRLGGPARYGGRLVEREYVGREFAPAERADIERVISLSTRVGELALAVGLAVRWDCWLLGRARGLRGSRRPRAAKSARVR